MYGRVLLAKYNNIPTMNWYSYSSQQRSPQTSFVKGILCEGVKLVLVSSKSI